MKASEKWAFSVPLSRVNVLRILEEAGLLRLGSRRVVRFSIAGHVFTAWREASYAGRVGVVDADDPTTSWLVTDDQMPPVRHPKYGVSVARWAAYDTDHNGVRVERGDHVGALVDRVETVVEVF